MDTAAFALARDSNLPLRIFDMSQPGVLLRVLRGEEIGTLVRRRRGLGIRIWGLGKVGTCRHIHNTGQNGRFSTYQSYITNTQSPPTKSVRPTTVAACNTTI